MEDERGFWQNGWAMHRHRGDRAKGTRDENFPATMFIWALTKHKVTKTKPSSWQFFSDAFAIDNLFTD